MTSSILLSDYVLSSTTICLLLDHKADLFIENDERKTLVNLILDSDLGEQLLKHNKGILDRIAEKTKAQDSNTSEQLSRCFPMLESNQPTSALSGGLAVIPYAGHSHNR